LANGKLVAETARDLMNLMSAGCTSSDAEQDKKRQDSKRNKKDEGKGEESHSNP